MLLAILVFVMFVGGTTALAKKTGGLGRSSRGRLGGSRSRSSGRSRGGGSSRSSRSGKGRTGGRSRSKIGGRTGRAASRSRAGRTSSGRGSWLLLKAWNSSGAPKTSETSWRGTSAVLTGKAAGAGARGTAWATRKLRGIDWRGSRGGDDLTCTKCGDVIRGGEPHVTIDRHIESLRNGTATVKDAEALAYYHERCEPKANQQPFAGHQPANSTTPDSKPQPATTPPPVHVNPFRSNKGEPVAIDTPSTFDRAAVPPTLAPHLNHIAELAPENDADLLNFLKEEVTGMLAYAEAINTMFEHCVTEQGLDPAAMQGVNDYAEAFAENAEAAAKGHQQFLSVYEALIQAANDGVQMPYNGRFFSGEAAA